MACLLFFGILSDFLSEPFLAALRFVEADLGITLCMGGHAAITLFIMCTARDIAIFYINYVLSIFQRWSQFDRELISSLL
jgi:hypothetical protein